MTGDEKVRRFPVRAKAALEWLQAGDTVVATAPDRELLDDELTALARMMLARFETVEGFTWSSYLVATCLDSFAEAAAGTPEVLLRVVWDAFEDVPPRRDVFMFAKAIGAALRGGLHQLQGWDLGWMLEPTCVAQACLRYWCIGILPELVHRVPDEDPHLKDVLNLQREYMPDLRRRR